MKPIQNRLAFLAALLTLPAASVLGPSPAAAAGAGFHSVVYVEADPVAGKAAIAAFQAYVAANRTQGGFINAELFEQTGRPGHFVFIESWQDQGSMDARPAAIGQDLAAALLPVRVSDIDRRPYKPLLVDARPASRGAVYVIAHVDSAPNPETPGMLQRLAEASRGEQGNLRFDVLQHTVRANHFMVIEEWTDRKALQRHATAAHTRRYRDEFGPLAGSPLDERVFQRVARWGL